MREYCFYFGQNRLHSLERKLYTLAEFFTLQANLPSRQRTARAWVQC